MKKLDPNKDIVPDGFSTFSDIFERRTAEQPEKTIMCGLIRTNKFNWIKSRRKE